MITASLCFWVYKYTGRSRTNLSCLSSSFRSFFSFFLAFFSSQQRGDISSKCLASDCIMRWAFFFSFFISFFTFFFFFLSFEEDELEDESFPSAFLEGKNETRHSIHCFQKKKRNATWNAVYPWSKASHLQSKSKKKPVWEVLLKYACSAALTTLASCPQTQLLFGFSNAKPAVGLSIQGNMLQAEKMLTSPAGPCVSFSRSCALTSEWRFLQCSKGYMWRWVKKKVYTQKTLLVERKIDQNLWSLEVFFLTHSHVITTYVVDAARGANLYSTFFFEYGISCFSCEGFATLLFATWAVCQSITAQSPFLWIHSLNIHTQNYCNSSPCWSGLRWFTSLRLSHVQVSMNLP